MVLGLPSRAMAFTEPFPEYDYQHDDWVDGEPVIGEVPLPPVRAPGSTTSGRRVPRAGATAMLTALALAYREVFEPEKKERVVLEVEASEPFHERPIEFVMVPGNPRASRIIVRRWLSR